MSQHDPRLDAGRAALIATLDESIAEERARCEAVTDTIRADCERRMQAARRMALQEAVGTCSGLDEAQGRIRALMSAAADDIR